MDVFKVWVPLRKHLSVQALCGTAIALYWKISERQNSTHMAFLKPKNTKTSLYKLSKDHWVIAFSKNSQSVRRKLQSTVSLDHPGVMCYQSRVEFCHDRRHRQSSEICASCVNFSRKQRAFLQNSHRSTRFTLRNCDFILNLLKFHTLNFLAQKYGCVNFMTNLMSNRQLNQYNHPNQCYSFPSIYLSRSEILL